ncbi:porin family protein [Algoriphagus sp. SE2]|uniref:porin family protein n=1 Tax=Algoriphagus sp. SE2 TaxID=3141536 RepID=UPI0031CCFDA1
MKFIRIVAFAAIGLFTHSSVQAQVLLSLIFGDKLNNEENAFGIHLDYSFNNISNLPESNYQGSFNLGIFFSHRVNDHWEMNLDLLGKYVRGAKGIPAYPLLDPSLDSKFTGTTINRKINYVSAPITIRYKNKKGIFLEAGPQFALRTKKAFDYFETDLPDGELNLKVDIKDQVKQFDISYVIGLGMYIGKDKINALGIRYYGGLIDVMKNLESGNKHSQFAIYTNIPIGRAKAGLK